MADYPHTVDRWDDATGEIRDYLDALETYRAAVKRWPKDKITLRNRARVSSHPCPPRHKCRVVLPVAVTARRAEWL